jgi:tetratricopeptide (TPR) repeat protein
VVHDRHTLAGHGRTTDDRVPSRPATAGITRKRTTTAQRSPHSSTTILTRFCWLLIAAALVLASGPTAHTAEPILANARDDLHHGRYEAVIAAAAEAIDRRTFGEDWYLLKIRAELALGQVTSAWQTVERGLQRYQWSIRLRDLGRTAAEQTGRVDQITVWKTEVQDLAARSPWRYSDADSLVSMGRFALELGADPKQVLEQLYDRALALQPGHVEARTAAGMLALQKQDDQLAAETFQQALEIEPENPDLHWGLAQGLRQSDGSAAGAAIAKALELNPRHVPSLVFRAEQAIDAEQYSEARRWLGMALAVNSRSVEAWTLLAVILHVENDPAAAALMEDQAYGLWRTNPAVPSLIGSRLSRKYRFQEGADWQRLALQFNSRYLPAQVQLVQDLSRLGQLDESWALADRVQQQDGYDVQMFNLLELRDRLAAYHTREQDNIRLRMESREAAVYGEDALRLLIRARQTLSQKYGLQSADPITVELFPEPQDFAVRTFGLPGASGFLGVCFGRVITANSPASQAAHPANWQSVLWHEMCHSITLELSRHRMPRWLSEGISVYEERQADPAWGQRMTPWSRDWILKGGLTPLADMSSAFLSPASPQHLNFAYFQSSLIVEYLIERVGLETLTHVLQDLAAGLPIQVALDRRYGSLEQLDAEFQEYAKRQAQQFGQDLDWTEYDLSAVMADDDPQRLLGWLDDHPNSVVGLRACVGQLLNDRQWPQAQLLLERWLHSAPEDVSPTGPYGPLWRVYREQGQVDAERSLLRRYVARSDAAVTALLRLIELDTAVQDWAAVADSARRLRAVNPLLLSAQRATATAAAAQEHLSEAAEAWRAVLALAPNDRADAHFQLAQIYHRLGDPRAETEVLQALELAPRFDEAQRLLLMLVDTTMQAAPPDNARIDLGPTENASPTADPGPNADANPNTETDSDSNPDPDSEPESAPDPNADPGRQADPTAPRSAAAAPSAADSSNTSVPPGTVNR